MTVWAYSNWILCSECTLSFCDKSYGAIRTSKWIQKSTRRSRVWWFDWLDEHKSSRICDATILDLAVPSGPSWGASPFHAPGEDSRQGDGCRSSNERILAGLVNNLITSTWYSAMDSWWQLWCLVLLGLSEIVSVRWCIVRRCWNKEVSCTNVQTWSTWFEGSSLAFPLKPKSKVLNRRVWKASAEHRRI